MQTSHKRRQVSSGVGLADFILLSISLLFFHLYINPANITMLGAKCVKITTQQTTAVLDVS